MKNYLISKKLPKFTMGADFDVFNKSQANDFDVFNKSQANEFKVGKTLNPAGDNDTSAAEGGTEGGVGLKGADIAKGGLQLASLASPFIDKATTTTTKDLSGNEYSEENNWGAAATGAIKGAAMGASFGPIGMGAGALIGGATSYFMNDSNNKVQEDAKKKSNDAFTAKYNAISKGNYNSAVAQGFKPQGGYASMYKHGGTIKYPYGGKVNPEYEVEDKEVVQGEDTNLEGQNNLASDMTKAVGERHENGGVKGEGGERVFSDRIPIGDNFNSTLKSQGIKVKPTDTYAKVAEILGKKKGLFETKSKSNNAIANTTGKLMLDKINNLIDTTFNTQEVVKQQEYQTYQKALGGYLAKGGDIDEWSKFGSEEKPNTSIVAATNNKSDNFGYSVEDTPIEKMNPVKKAVINNPISKQASRELPKDVNELVEQHKQNPAWMNFKNASGKEGHYTILSKEDGNDYLFDRNHTLISSTPAGRGKQLGDESNTANANSKGKNGATTPAMATTIKAIRNDADTQKNYGTPTFVITNPDKYNQVLAKHGIYKNELEKRKAVINDPNLKAKLVSWGCINEDKDYINDQYKKGNYAVGDSVFVTREPIMKDYKLTNRKFGGKLPKFGGDDGTTGYISPKVEYAYKNSNRLGKRPYSWENKVDENNYDGIPTTAAIPFNFQNNSSVIDNSNDLLSNQIVNNKSVNGFSKPNLSSLVADQLPTVNNPFKGNTSTGIDSTSKSPNRFNGFKKRLNKVGSVLNENGDQLLNAGIGVANYLNADKQQTNINRETPLPNYVKAPNIYNQAKYDINRTTNTMAKGLDASGNVQDNFARKALLHGNAINELNQVAQKQGELDSNANNTNVGISNQFNALKASNANEDNIDRVQGKNTILKNKQNVINTALQGFMGNQTTKKAYDIEKEKNDIARISAGRDTDLRSDYERYINGEKGDTFRKDYSKSEHLKMTDYYENKGMKEKAKAAREKASSATYALGGNLRKPAMKIYA